MDFVQVVRFPEVLCRLCTKRFTADTALWPLVAERLHSGAGKLSLDMLKLGPQTAMTRRFFEQYGALMVEQGLHATQAASFASATYLRRGLDHLDELSKWLQHNDEAPNQPACRMVNKLRQLVLVRSLH